MDFIDAMTTSKRKEDKRRLTLNMTGIGSVNALLWSILQGGKGT
jgi:hypothetical protein